MLTLRFFGFAAAMVAAAACVWTVLADPFCMALPFGRAGPKGSIYPYITLGYGYAFLAWAALYPLILILCKVFLPRLDIKLAKEDRVIWLCGYRFNDRKSDDNTEADEDADAASI